MEVRRIDKTFIGSATALSSLGDTQPITRVTLYLDDESYVTAGDDTGREITSDCPWATQEMADAILQSLSGKVYRAVEAGAALLEPAAELGDAVTVGGVYTVLTTIEDNSNAGSYRDISAPLGGDMEHEYPYTDPVIRKIERKIAQDETYFKVELGNIEGYVSEVESGLTAKINLTASGLEGKITSTKEGLENQISVTASGLDTKITDTKNSLTNTINATASALTARIENAEGDVSEISEKVDSISFTVTNRSASSRFELTAGRTVLSSGTIEFTGDVVFADDLSDGTTRISGDCIRTGTVSLDYLDISDRNGSLTIESGSNGIDGTRGPCLTGPDSDVYLIVTNEGCRMTAGRTDFYVIEDRIHGDVEYDTGSDISLKHSVVYDLSDRYKDFYRELRPARFKYYTGKSDRYHTGFVAQDMKQALSDSGLNSQDLAALVQTDYNPETDDGGLYSVRYSELIALNTAMIQSLMVELDALKAEVKQLKGY